MRNEIYSVGDPSAPEPDDSEPISYREKEIEDAEYREFCRDERGYDRFYP